MTIWGAMIVILFAGIVFGFIGMVMIEVNRRFITDDLEKVLYSYTDYVMKKSVDMTVELQKKMMEDSDDPLER